MAEVQNLRYPVGGWFEGFNPAVKRFMRGLLAEVLAAAVAYLGNYLIENPMVWAGVFVGLGPALQAWSKSVRDKKLIVLPF